MGPRMASMNGLARWALLISSACFVAATGSAGAQPNIGAAAETKNEVSRQLAGAGGKLDVGDPVFRDEIVQTGADALAKLVFLDSTNLAIGPTSRVVLDRFVYASGESADSVTIRLSKGLFRFTTGNLDKRAYSIVTPTAAIGVRGTVLDIESRPVRTRVTLVEGRAVVCPLANAAQRSHRRDCVTLEHPGETAEVSLIGGADRASLTSATVNFASYCSGSICASSTYASIAKNESYAQDANNLASPDAGLAGAALCGR